MTATPTIAYGALATLDLGEIAPKPTSLAGNPQEAAATLWTSADGLTEIGVWECTPGRFSADRRDNAELCCLLSGAATLTGQDGARLEVQAGDLFLLPKGWQGEWTLHETTRKIWIMHESGAATPAPAQLLAHAASHDTGAPSPKGKATAGQPLETVANLWTSPDGRVDIGLWTCTPGAFRADFDEDAELCHILSGTVTLTDAGGTACAAAGGDMVAMPLGWHGTWTVHSDLRKIYIVAVEP